MAILSFSFQAAQGVRAFTWRGRSVAGGMCGLVHGFGEGRCTDVVVGSETVLEELQ